MRQAIENVRALRFELQSGGREAAIVAKALGEVEGAISVLNERVGELQRLNGGPLVRLNGSDPLAPGGGVLASDAGRGGGVVAGSGSGGTGVLATTGGSSSGGGGGGGGEARENAALRRIRQTTFTSYANGPAVPVTGGSNKVTADGLAITGELRNLRRTLEGPTGAERRAASEGLF